MRHICPPIALLLLAACRGSGGKTGIDEDTAQAATTTTTTTTTTVTDSDSNLCTDSDVEKGDSGVAAVVYGNYTANNDRDLMALVGVVEITGDLAVAGVGVSSINELEALANVGGSLYIYSNPMLANLDGLRGLASVGGDVRVDNNALLCQSIVDGFLMNLQIGGVVLIDSPNKPGC